MSDTQDTPKLWSNCSPGELLDMAQVELHDRGPDVALVFVAAAQAQATASLDWTLQNRWQR